MNTDKSILDPELFLNGNDAKDVNLEVWIRQLENKLAGAWFLDNGAAPRWINGRTRGEVWSLLEPNDVFDVQKHKYQSAGSFPRHPSLTGLHGETQRRRRSHQQSLDKIVVDQAEDRGEVRRLLPSLPETSRANININLGTELCSLMEKLNASYTSRLVGNRPPDV